MAEVGGEAAPPRRGSGTRSKRGGDRHSEAAQIEEANRVRDVLRYRQAGMDFDDIARLTGYADASGPRSAFRRAIAKVTAEPARDAVALAMLRSDALLRAVWTEALKGKIGAHQQALATIAFQAKLQGIGGVTKLDITTDGAVAEVERVASDIMAMLQAAAEGTPE